MRLVHGTLEIETPPFTAGSLLHIAMQYFIWIVLRLSLHYSRSSFTIRPRAGIFVQRSADPEPSDGLRQHWSSSHSGTCGPRILRSAGRSKDDFPTDVRSLELSCRCCMTRFALAVFHRVRALRMYRYQADPRAHEHRKRADTRDLDRRQHMSSPPASSSSSPQL